MSHEAQTRPLLVVEPEYDWNDSITSTANNLNYFYVPSLPEWARSEYDGLIYEGVTYSWSEVDYRLSAQVPEPSFIAMVMGLCFLVLIFFKRK
jgi:hypothetical protein